MFNSIKHIALLLLAFALFSCSEDKTNPVINDEIEMNLIETQTFGDYTYKVYSEDTEVKEGNSVLYVRATDKSNNSIAKDLTVGIIMYMETMNHSTPYLVDVKTIDGVEFVVVDATFIMPSVNMGKWVLTLDSDELTIDQELEITVAPTGKVKKFKFEEKSYFVTLRSLENAKVGMNDFIISVHTRENMMFHPYVDDLTIVAEPFMPSMGHGSNGNVNPTFTSQGIYVGKVNFNMTGDWEVRLTLTRDGKVIGNPVFALDL